MTHDSKTWDVIVLGAGAAGLMAAITAAKKGFQVLVLERANKVGKKILMSGGGRCNFTNMYATADNYLSQNRHFCKSAMSQYTVWDFIELVNRHDIPYHEKELGQLFCDRSSKDIVNMLLDECADQGVTIRMTCETSSVDFADVHQVHTNQGSFNAKHLIVATGGLSIPKMGGSGFGYQLAEQLGLKVLPKRAGLVPLVFSDQYKALFSSLAGVSVEVTATAGKQSFTHHMLFTHRGLSGPVVLQISSYWDLGDPLTIDLMPHIVVKEALVEAKKEQPNQSLLVWLSGHWPKQLAQAWLVFHYPEWAQVQLQQLSHADCEQLAQSINGWQLKPAATEGYRTAEVTLGGVDTDALSSKTMAVKSQPNVFFIGEVVDVTGHLGGFNFQWAWSSGFAAGHAIS